MAGRSPARRVAFGAGGEIGYIGEACPERGAFTAPSGAGLKCGACAATTATVEEREFVGG
jgi:hypothetical protein